MSAADHERIATAYLRFAEEEARGRSPLYEALARGVAVDRDILDLLAALPPSKRQPNLLLAAVRYRLGTPRDWCQFRGAVLNNAASVRATMLARSTQTNEPGRCTALLPILALLPQPLALIEVGASAGLCLLPDRYGYDYGGWRIRPPDEMLATAGVLVRGRCEEDPVTGGATADRRAGGADGMAQGVGLAGTDRPPRSPRGRLRDRRGRPAAPRPR